MSNRKILFKKYISTHFENNLDFSNKRLKNEYIQFDNNLENLKNETEANILEIGFGTGYLLKYFLANKLNNFFGIEISEEIVDFVKKNITNKVALVKSTEDYLKKNKNTYDYIILFDVLEHIPKMEAINFLNLIHISLKKGGKVIIRVPNGANPFNIQIFNDDFTHEFFFTQTSLTQVLKLAKFTNINVKAWKEENITLQSKITNLTSTISYFIIKLIIGLNRNYFNPNNPLSRNLIAICTK